MVTDQPCSTLTKEMHRRSTSTWRRQISNITTLYFSLSWTRCSAQRGSSQTSSFAWNPCGRPFWVIPFVRCSAVCFLDWFSEQKSPSVQSPCLWLCVVLAAKLVFWSARPCSRGPPHPQFLFLPWSVPGNGLLVWNTVWVGKTKYHTDWLKSLVL